MSIEQLRVALRDRDAEIRRRAVLSADQEPSLDVAERICAESSSRERSTSVSSQP